MLNSPGPVVSPENVVDGQDFDFEDGRRPSGTGTWQLTDGDGGQVVRLALTARTRVESRSPATATGTSADAPSADYSPGSNPHPPSPPAVRVTSPSRPTKAVVLTGSLGTEADVTRREIGQ